MSARKKSIVILSYLNDVMLVVNSIILWILFIHLSNNLARENLGIFTCLGIELLVLFLNILEMLLRKKVKMDTQVLYIVIRCILPIILAFCVWLGLCL